MSHPSPPGIRVRPLASADLAAVASLHARALPDGFFAGLGERFLRAYYRSFLASPVAVALVAASETDVVGAIVGPARNADHYRWVVRRHGLRLALSGALALLARPAELRRFLRTRVPRYVRALSRMLGLSRSSGRAVSRADRAPDPEVAVLTHVAVAGSARGSGAGRDLVAAFVEECRANGAREVRLVTNSSEGAAGFYRRLGWDEVAERSAADGTVVTEFRLDLEERPRS